MEKQVGDALMDSFYHDTGLSSFARVALKIKELLMSIQLV